MEKFKYRTHTCNEISESDIEKEVKLAGWIQSIRDHGGVIFLDLRDQYGVSQVVVHDEEVVKKLCKETVISATRKSCKT